MNQYFLQDSFFSEFKKLMQKKNYAEAEKNAFVMTSTPEHRAAGLYCLSLIADSKKEIDKSLWLVEKADAVKKDDDELRDLINYQKAKVLYSVKDFNSAFKFFGKVLDKKNVPPEITTILGIKHFSDGDYLEAEKEFSRLSTEQNYNYGMDLLHIDSILMKGDVVKAQNTAERYSRFKSDRVPLLLEQARIFESTGINQKKAIDFYQKALAVSHDVDQKEWIKKKIEFLKLNKSNQITSNVGGQ